MKHILGISAGFHDAAATVIRSDGEIVFAGHSERYSKKKNDPTIAPGLLKSGLGIKIRLVTKSAPAIISAMQPQVFKHHHLTVQ